MSLYRDEGVVLRTQKLGEADRIVTLLTRQNGRVRAVAKGVRRTTSRFGARLEPFSMVDVQLHRGRSLDIVTQVETLAPYGERLVGDYPSYTAGQAMLETAERLTEEGEPAVQQFLLLVGGLRAMVAGQRGPGQVLDSYLLRSLAVAGYAPSFDHCARCGLEGPHRWFNPAYGGMLCTTCRVPGSAACTTGQSPTSSAPRTVTVSEAGVADPGSRSEAQRTPPAEGLKNRCGPSTPHCTQWSNDGA